MVDRQVEPGLVGATQVIPAVDTCHPALFKDGHPVTPTTGSVTHGRTTKQLPTISVIAIERQFYALHGTSEPAVRPIVKLHTSTRQLPDLTTPRSRR